MVVNGRKAYSRNSNIQFSHVVAVTLTDDAGDADANKIMVSRSRTLYSITYSVTVSVTAGRSDDHFNILESTSK